MNSQWHAFLLSVGAVSEGGGTAPANLSLAGCTLYDLSHLGLIRVRGEDAASFLQGQLTNDTRQLDAEHSQMSAFCSPKGRMLASFRLFRLGDDILMQLPRSRMAPILQRLRMFVLRSKVALEDASDALGQMALTGDCATAVLGELAPASADQVIQAEGCACVRLSGDRPRFLLAGTVDALSTIWRRATDAGAACGDSASWRLLDIRAGTPTIYEQTVEAFVPQMANLQLLNGVSFKKGCYTGQEVVARMQYLGKLKRRMYRVWIDATSCPEPGTELFSAGSESGQGTGRIVDAAPSPDGGCEALAVIETAAAETGDVRIGDAQGARLEFLDLPYGFESGETASRG